MRASGRIGGASTSIYRAKTACRRSNRIRTWRSRQAFEKSAFFRNHGRRKFRNCDSENLKPYSFINRTIVREIVIVNYHDSYVKSAPYQRHFTLLRMWHYRRGPVSGWVLVVGHVSRALLYCWPQPAERYRKSSSTARYCVRRHRQARRYTLRIRPHARSRPYHSAARHAQGSARFAQKHGGWIAARLGRLPEGGAVRERHRISLRGMPHRIAHRRNVRGTAWTRPARMAGGCCVAGDAPHVDRRVGDFLRREARRDSKRPAGSTRPRSVSRADPADLGARSGEPLGLLLDRRRLSYSWRLILAPSFVLRLSRRPRSGASCRDEPLGTFLATGAAALSRS